jgi:uncharacterized protein YeeX (DUF496 family)
MSFVDLILEKRVKYLKNIERRIRNILDENPIENLKRLMFVEKDVPESRIIDYFIENAKKEAYFKNLYEKIKGKPFTWETLKSLKEIAGITEIHHDSLIAPFAQVTTVIDRIYAPFLEPLRGFPRVYASGEYPKGFGLEPNCVGACQVIPVLYSYEHDVKDLSFVEVYSSKRRDNLLEKLKELKDKKDEWVLSDFDTFFYDFQTDELKNMVLDQALGVEEFTHGAIKNKVTGEIYDYELERENYKGTIEKSLEDGIFYSTLSNMLFLMDYLGYNKEILKDTFNQYYDKFKDSVLMNSVGLALYIEEEKSRDFLNKIKNIYETEDELPARYHAIEIALDYPEALFNKELKDKIKGKLDHLKGKYLLPTALQHISQRYLQSDLLIQIDKNFVRDYF